MVKIKDIQLSNFLTMHKKISDIQTKKTLFWNNLYYFEYKNSCIRLILINTLTQKVK